MHTKLEVVEQLAEGYGSVLFLYFKVMENLVHIDIFRRLEAIEELLVDMVDIEIGVHGLELGEILTVVI